jgi:phytoene/squalene synthetase
MRYEIDVARRMLIEGAQLSRMVDRRLRRDVLMFAGGGLAILRAIEAVGCDVFRHRPELSKIDYLKLGWRAWRGRFEV